MVALVVLALLDLQNTVTALPACPAVSTVSGPWKGSPLHEAIRRNDVTAARHAIAVGGLNERDSLGNTPLVAALTLTVALEPAGIGSAERTRARIQAERAARYAIASALLDRGAAVNEAGPNGTTPLLQIAGSAGDVKSELNLIERLLTAGASINTRDDFGTTPLMAAAGRGKSQLVTILLSKGADPALENCGHQTAASLAKANGHEALSARLAVAQRQGAKRTIK